MKNQSRQQQKISVRGMVEFLLRNGDIDNRGKGASADAMQEGTRIHRMIQKRMGGDYRAEVPLRHICDAGEYDILVDGRADGIFPGDGCDVIDEIKGVYRDVTKLEAPDPVHLAQAKCYGAMLLADNPAPAVGVQMTYCSLIDREIKRFNFVYDAGEVLDWFEALVREYKKWTDLRHEWIKQRTTSIHALEFPFEYRSGQKELASQVYRTIYLKKRLFLEAPTGVGKTVSTLFPAVKAMGEGLGEMIFYLTAKTTTAAVARETFDIMRRKGLKIKTVKITAKEKQCFMEETDCNPEKCPYAKGHFDRINEAMYELLTREDDLNDEVISKQAGEHMVCPFELCLDLSLFADAVIGDYNYVFDPNVALKRFFEAGTKGDYIFLIDEAHNLVDRAREMYSAEIYKRDVLEAKRLVGTGFKKLSTALNRCNKLLLDMSRECDGYEVLENADGFIMALTSVASLLDEVMDDEDYAPLREDILDFYFDVRHFMNMAELLDENYVVYTGFDEEEDFFIRLYCVNPAVNLRSCLDKGISACFFSATLLPVEYYMDLLSGDRQDYAVYAPSPFDPAKRGVFVATDVSSRYKRRGKEEYSRIASYIHDAVKLKRGNYMVFFPSYRFMEDVIEVFEEMYPDPGFEVLYQNVSMTEQEKEEFLGCFEEENGNYVGFCVLGGVFSEGIDLREDCLIGAVIVGTGLPRVGDRLDILREYFDETEGRGRGFDYAYRIPGMNKVLQAAGRVIRTANDRGVILLLDERFAMREYRTMFPREWEGVFAGDKGRVLEKMADFWHTIEEV
ncbi:MAG: ATP-dependent DNA helicase [Lachnospiraceae bacterium]|nr:ATP-dependent DNA helicase [Lachnospiraceae bacterium]